MGLATISTIFLIGLGAGAALGQSIRINLRIVTFAAGGGSDFAARLIAQGLPPGLGQQVIVDNRTTLTATEAVLKAAPDGYTVPFTGSSFWIQTLMQKASYDPVRDFSIDHVFGKLSTAFRGASIACSKVSQELISLAKARPETLTMLRAGRALTHLAAELFRSMAGVNIVRISYKANGLPLQVCSVANLR